MLGVYKDIDGNVLAAEVSDLTEDEAIKYGARGGHLDYVEKVLTAGLAFRRRSACGGSMQLSAWAENHARGLLSPLGRRWRHAHAVADTAGERQGLAPEDADVLVV